jgi:Tfp pilus assembly protein PilX
MTQRFRLLQQESGSALVAAIMILAIISMLGVVVAQAAIVQSHQTGNERTGEMAFNLAESALDAEASLLQKSWPSSSATAYPVCTQASTASSTCPQGSISNGYSTAYAGSGFASPTWSVQVIDDNVPGVADQSYYSDAILSNPNLLHYDSGNPPDNQLWIRADATIRGQHRIVVASIGRQTDVITLPQSVVTSGGISTSNNGNKVIIEAKDSSGSGLTGSVNVRCDGTPGFSNSNNCVGWDPKQGQLDPASAYQTDYQDPSNNLQALSNGVLEQLRESAQAANTYYPAGTCPAYGATGLLFVENANCSYQGTGGVPWGSDTSPAALIIASGTLTFGANVNFYGVVYLADGQETSVPSNGVCTSAQQNNVFTVQGGGAIHGGLFVDKCGTVDAGDKAFDIVYDVKAFGGVKSYATPTLALNTFKIVGNS